MVQMLRISRETEFYQGYIRFKMAISNESPSVITDVTLDFIYDDELLNVSKHEPEYSLKNGKILLRNIDAGKSKSIAIYFDPLMCSKGTDINCHITYKDHQGNLEISRMEPKEISVVCPIMKTESDINIGRLKEFIANLPTKDSRFYEIKSGFNVEKLTSLAREVVEKHDVRHVRTLHTRDGKSFEIWYYGNTKVTKDAIVIKISISTEHSTMELFAATRNAETLTGLLAEIGRDLKRTIESQASGKGGVINVTIRDSIVQRSNLLDMCNIDGTCDVNVVIEGSLLQRTNLATVGEGARLKQEQNKQDEQEHLQKKQEEPAALKSIRLKFAEEFERNQNKIKGVKKYEKAENKSATSLKKNGLKYKIIAIAIVLIFLSVVTVGYNSDPTNAEDLTNNGLALFEEGRYTEAIESCDKAIEIDPNYASPWNIRGVALKEIGRNAEAIESFDKAIEIDPNFASPWNNRGTILFEEGRYAEAIESYDKAIEIDPNYEISWKCSGVALLREGRYAEAIESLDKAIEIDPNFAHLWAAHGSAFHKLGRNAEAIESFDKAIEIDPNYAIVWKSRGVVLFEEGRYTEAIESFDKAIETNPNFEDAWNYRGVALSELGRCTEALESYDKALEIDPNYVIALYNRGLALSELSRYAEAIESYDKAIEINPNDTYALNERELALEKLK